MSKKKTSQEVEELRLVTVVIPLYTLNLNVNELLSLRQCFSVLGNHDIAIVKPHSLDVSALPELIGGNPKFRVEEFDDSYFAGREGYNRMMLSAEFYSRFLTSRYIFIHQTDVYVFRDELERWCLKGYDYVGAPWLPAIGDVKGFNMLRRFVYDCRRLNGRLTPGFHSINLKYKVGNGGCSLRHVEHTHHAACILATSIAEVAAYSSRTENFEDVFWSVRVNELSPGAFRIPPYTEAVYFSV
ncbi:MAG: hypothetical protein IK092_03730, partial [Muribaculaceae bacterium]|nr:hypothetical protein [Muribaculaceae bacterium]